MNNVETPKVLVCAPTNEVKGYALEEWAETVQNLTYPNYDVFLCDNSKTHDFRRKLRKMGFITDHIRPKQKDVRYTIAQSHERCRNYFMKRPEYRYMLHLETDVIPPVDIIERLRDGMTHHKKVVGAMYHIDEWKYSHLMIQKREKFGELRLVDNLEDDDMGFVDGTIKQVYSMGLGCLLIDRKVLELIQFRAVEGMDAHPDSFFAADLDELEISQWLDTSILCKHLNKPELHKAHK